MLSTRRPTAGFTLIELLVIIALIGILAATSLPSFVIWIQNAKIRTAAESLSNGVRKAQTEALRRNREVVFLLTNAAPSITAIPAASGRNWATYVVPIGTETSELIDSTKSADSLADVSYEGKLAAGGTVSTLCFNANGRLVTDAAVGCTAALTTFDVSHPKADRKLRVIVQLGGQVRTCDLSRVLSASTPDGCPAIP